MEGAIETVTRGNVAEVKIVLASVVVVLAVYQVLLMAVGYGKLRPRFLAAAPASAAHRAIGDAIVVVTALVAVACVSYFGFEDDASAHVIVASALLAVLALKIVVVRWWHRMGGLLPFLGTSVLILFWATWATVAAEYVLS